MSERLGDVFMRFGSRYPALLSADTLAPLMAQFGAWPDTGLAALGFEIRFDDNRTVDLSGLIINPRAAQEALRPLLQPGWRPLLDLLAAWERDWLAHIYNVVFEFDARQTRPMPAIFLQRCMPPPQPKGGLAETFAALASVAGPIAPAFVTCTERVESHACYIAALLSRADGLYRLALPATIDTVEEILSLLEWRGSYPALRAVLGELVSLHSRHYGLDVDWVDGSLHDKIGIDIVIPHLPTLLPWLDARGLIAPAIRDEVSRLRGLNHVKLVFAGDRIVQCKAYLRYNFPHASRDRV